MKLYLSSYRIPHLPALEKLLDAPLSGVKVGIVPNAGDYYAERARNFKINEKKDYLKELGFKKISVVDLRKYTKRGDLKADLQQTDMLWVGGGNTFCLREEMKNSGFDKLIATQLERGLVYVGESAGAVVAGNSLRSIDYADEPAFAAKIHWSGLKLIDNYVLPHVGSPYFEEAITKAKQDHKDNPTLLELTDDQALVVDGDSRKIVAKSV